MNRSRLYLLLAFLAAPLVFSACIVDVDVDDDDIRIEGSGVVIEVNRSVDREVRGVSLETIGTLEIVLGDAYTLRIEAEDNIERRIETRVRGNVLYIEEEDHIQLRPNHPIQYTLTVPTVDDLTLAGSGRILAPDLDVARLDVTLSGSGEIDVPNLHADHVDARLSGSGDLFLSGDIQDQDLTISGSGRYDARDLESDEADVTITGSGAAYVFAHDELDVRITGSGTVYYKGSPQISQQITGSGRITPL